MHITTLSFVYLFLPVSILAFYAAPKSTKLPVLAAISGAFYFLLQPRDFLVFGSNVLVDFALLQLAGSIRQERPDSYRRVLALCGAKAAAILVYLLWARSGQLPLGLFIYTFTLLGYLYDLLESGQPPESSFVCYSLLTTFFGKAYVGPIVRSEQFLPALKQLRPSLTSISRGLVTFILGLSKKVILADGLLELHQQLRMASLDGYTGTVGWALALSLALGMFFGISAYGDMAKGLCAVFSIPIPRTTYFPYQAKSLEECISRLNMPLYDTVIRLSTAELRSTQAHWRKLNLRELLPVCLAILSVALWLQWSSTFLLWGLFICVLVCCERLAYYRFLRYFPKVMHRFFTFFIILMSFVPLSIGNLHEGVRVMGYMIGLGEMSAPSNQILYLLSNYYLLLLVGLLLSTSLLDNLSRYAANRFPRLTESVNVVVHCSLLIITTALLL